MRKPNTSEYIGLESQYKGSLTKIVRLERSRMSGVSKFWCRVLDHKNKSTKMGEEFPLAIQTVYKNFRSKDHGSN